MSPDTEAVLDPRTVVPPDPSSPQLDGLLKDWPDQDRAREILESIHRRELERAAQPPVINVTVAGVPGRFTAVAGSGQAAWGRS